MNLYEAIFNSHSMDKGKIAVLFDSLKMTFHDLEKSILKTIYKFKLSGFSKENRIAIIFNNTPESLVAFLGVCNIGALCVPLNPQYKEHEMEVYFKEMEIDGLVVDKHIHTPAIEIAEKAGFPVVKFEITDIDVDEKLLKEDISSVSEDSLALALHTSGTTAQPKLVNLTHKNLCTGLRYIKKSLELSPKDRYLNIMPLFHAHGMLLSVASWYSGSSVAFTSVPDFFDGMSEFSPTWYSSSPSIHQFIVERAKNNELIIAQSKLRFIRSSAAYLPDNLYQKLQKIFKIPIIQGYGMSETSAYLTHNPLNEPRQGSVGISMGPEIKILANEKTILDQGKVGEIVVRGENVITSYGNPEVNKYSFYNDWLRTGDLGYLDEDGYLFIVGRQKEMINRGGEKISPYEIEDILLQHENVKECVVFSAPHTALGEDIATAIVLRKKEEKSVVDLKVFLRSRLAEIKVPNQFFVVDVIPKGPTGKLQRSKLAEHFIKNNSEKIEPRNFCEKNIAYAFKKVLKIDNVYIHDNFFSLGGYSLLIPELFKEIEDRIGKSISPAYIFENPTVCKLAYIFGFGEQMQNKSNFHILRNEGKRPPLILIHSAEGDGLNYYSFSKKISDQQPVYVLDAFFKDGGYVKFNSIEEMATHYIQTIEEKLLLTADSYLLGGHSFGGVVAYEMARQLQSKGKTPLAIILFDSVLRGRKWRELLFYWHFIRKLPSWFMYLVKDKNIWQRVKKILGLKSLYNVKIYIDELPKVNQEYAIHNIQKLVQYSDKRKPYRGKIVLFKVKKNESNHPLAYLNLKDYGWGKYSGSSVDCFDVDGEHGTVLNHEHVDSVVKKFEQVISNIIK